MNPQVLCLDGLMFDDDPEDRSSDVDGEDGVSGSHTYSGIRTTRSYRKVDGPVCRRPGRVSKTSAVARTFGPAVSVCPAHCRL